MRRWFGIACAWLIAGALSASIPREEQFHETLTWDGNSRLTEYRQSRYDVGFSLDNIYANLRVWKNASGQTNRTQTFSWDARGRLTRVIEHDSNQNGRDWSAIYDPLDRLLRTTDIPVTNGVAITSQPRLIDHFYDPNHEFLEIGVRENGVTTWKVLGPDLDGTYGIQNGTGGFEAIVPGPELFCPLITDALGNIHAVYDQGHLTLVWYPSRPTGYGAVPGYRPVPVGQAGADLGAEYAWRNRGIASLGYAWMGGNWYDPDGGRFLSFDTIGFAANGNPGGYHPLPDPINYWDPDGRLGQGNYLEIDRWGIRQGNSYDDFYLGRDATIGGETVDRGWAGSFSLVDQPSRAFNGGSFRMTFGDGAAGLAEFAVNLNVGVALAPVVATHEVGHAFALAGEASVSGTAGERAYAYTRAAVSVPMSVLAFAAWRPGITPMTPPYSVGVRTVGSGPARGFLEVSDAYPSSRAVQNFGSTRPTDFIFDAQSQRFIMGRGPFGHDSILQAGRITPSETTVGGRIFRLEGRLFTDEWSGHYGQNWTPQLRQQFQNFMRQHGANITHRPWGQ